jgi:cyclopropane-fatty-acyl-phospholipid synthase
MRHAGFSRENQSREGIVMNPFAQKLAERLIRNGTLLVTDSNGSVFRFGDGTGRPIHLRFNSRRAEAAVAFDPALRLGEAFMNGEIDMVDGSIYDFLELVFSNAGRRATGIAPWMKAINGVRLMTRRFTQLNSPLRARANIRHHYDLSAALYDLFLDSDRQYSCAYFRNDAMDLEQAQQAKKEHLAAKLRLTAPGLSVLDMGSGWGGLGLFFARRFDADVTGITLSREQHDFSSRRVQPKEKHKVRFLLQDFRTLDDSFDRIVSVGMFEHVGVPNYDVYFERCARLLRKDGIMVLHAIGRADVPSWTNPFIARYIFPGGYIPSLSEVMPAIERSGLYVTDVEILRLHYAQTLRCWRDRFLARREEAVALYGETFARMWEYYLASSEAAFRWQRHMVFQIQLTHDQAALPLTRDYIGDAERRIATQAQSPAHRRAG